MKQIHVSNNYFTRFIIVVFFIQTILLLCLVIEYKHGFLPDNPFYSIETNLEPTSDFNSWNDDLRVINNLMTKNSFSIYLIDKFFLSQIRRGNVNSTSFEKKLTPTLLASNFSEAKHQLAKIIQEFQSQNFEVVPFFNENPDQLIPDLSSVPIAIFLKRSHSFQVLFCHTRPGNFWWYGNIQSDGDWRKKLAFINFSSSELQLLLHEGAFEKFEVVKHDFGSTFGYIPKNVDRFLEEIHNCKFIECDQRRAQIFLAKHKIIQNPSAQRFQHKVYKILSLVSVVSRKLSVPFWLSSGTCLGYFRQCSVIPYTTDVDIGIFTESYKSTFEEEMKNHGFRLKHRFGFPNDSFELSFLLETDLSVKLDIFFFYKEDEFYWNGGTQVKTGKKFRYIFPKFHLCWTLFLNLKVRVPCETESYIVANYGPNWTEPIKQWDWKSSPNNVKSAGVWPRNQRRAAIQVF